MTRGLWEGPPNSLDSRMASAILAQFWLNFGSRLIWWPSNFPRPPLPRRLVLQEVKFGLQNGATLVTTCDSFGQPGAKDDAPFADAALSHERVVQSLHVRSLHDRTVL